MGINGIGTLGRFEVGFDGFRCSFGVGRNPSLTASQGQQRFWGCFEHTYAKAGRNGKITRLFFFFPKSESCKSLRKVALVSFQHFLSPNNEHEHRKEKKLSNCSTKTRWVFTEWFLGLHTSTFYLFKLSWIQLKSPHGDLGTALCCFSSCSTQNLQQNPLKKKQLVGSSNLGKFFKT